MVRPHMGLTSLAATATWLATLAVLAQAAWNPDHPHRSILERSVTSDVSSVSGKSFDFVIAGGGLAGLAVAARLSEWDNVTVLVVEAGGDGSDVADQIDIPGYSYLHSLTGSAYDWAYTTVAQQDSLNLTKYWPRGKGLGGSGAINGMFWGRGTEQDYNAWATLNPNAEETWDWQEISTYINKAENFSTPNATVQDYFSMDLNSSAHGSGGPIQSGFSEYIFDGVKNWIPAWAALGFDNVDHWGGEVRGAMISPSTLNMRNQTRSDSYAGYIQPLAPRSNLVILTGQQVTSVIFNSSTDASGNKYASGVTFQAATGETSYSVQANKEVILCGGTVGSPQLLQLSGVGPSSVLSALNIDVVQDLPVGYNLQDHVSYSMYWSTPANTTTWGDLEASTTLQATELTEYQDSHTGQWTYVNEAVGYVSMEDITDSSTASSYAATVLSEMNTTVADVVSWESLPDTVATGLLAQYEIQQQYLTSTNGQLEIILTMLGQNGDNVGIQIALQHPWSRGKIVVTSTDPFTKPSIDPDYFGVGYDIDIMQYGSLFARKLAATSPLSDLMITESAPGTSYTGDALSNYTKQNCGTEYHPLGTCSMLPQASGGVVNTQLLVYGTNNLRVIDASVIPLHISAHLMATTYGIAEKGSDIVKKRWAAAVTTTTTNTTSSGSGTTASPGSATDSSVTGADKAASTSSLSTGAKAGIGIGAAVGALALLGLLLFFFLRRRRNANSGMYNKTLPSTPREKAGMAGAGAAAAAGGQTPFMHRSQSPDWSHQQPYTDAYPSNQQYAMGVIPSRGGSASGASTPYGDAPYAAPQRPYAGQHGRNHSTDSAATADLASRAPMSHSYTGTGVGGGGQWEPQQRYTPVRLS